MEAKIHPKMFSMFIVTDRNQTGTVLTTCVESPKYEYSSYPSNASRGTDQSYFVPLVNPLNNWPMTFNFAPFVAHACKVGGMQFHENPTNGRWGMDEVTLLFK